MKLDALLDLRQKLATSSVYTLFGQFTALIVKFVNNILLAAFLFPEAFATLAIINSVITGFLMFSEIGIRSKVIESDKNFDKRFLNTAWTLQVLRGIFLYIVLCFSAFPLSRLYASPDILLALPIAGSILLLSGLTPTWIYEQNRKLVVSKQVFAEVSALLLSSCITIILAYLFESFWVLVLSLILNEAFKQVLFFYFARNAINSFEMHKLHAIEILKFGRWLLLSSIFGYLINHADKLILGAKIDKNLFGIYAIAFSIANIPIMIGVPFSAKIFLPLFKTLKPWETPDNRIHLQKYRIFLTLLLVAVSLTLLMVANPLVEKFYDSRYSLVAPILMLIVLAQMPSLVLISYDQIFLAAGDSFLFAKRIIITSIVRTLLMLIGLNYFGMLGLIVATGVASMATYPILLFFLRKYNGQDIYHDSLMFFIIFSLIIIISLYYQFDINHLQNIENYF